MECKDVFELTIALALCLVCRRPDTTPTLALCTWLTAHAASRSTRCSGRFSYDDLGRSPGASGVSLHARSIVQCVQHAHLPVVLR